ncbi:hypothetical protein J5069_00765 [Candidatus Symbiopectobacterium sp. NZEC127]|uniref:hypothetical protein n=1 Tax=Candidatus Symbiopectobacterium sp. NZEC127 TaxID=2820472 RepID=UPI002226A1D1|nr:hypothetical protein [Candidatus Symbiopectobacterium sp. NZEC127]MCW2484421.1 hypothetical protein [Candidatus Symbiopectobacterium sp. NZEC127]
MSQQAQRDLAELMGRLVTLLLAGYMARQQTISLVNDVDDADVMKMRTAEELA